MDINAAKCAFKNILNSLSKEDRSTFLSWCEESLAEINCSKSYFELRTIAEDIKTLVPVEAILPSENVDNSQVESSSDGTCKPVLHVDSFLFEEEHVDALEAEGKIKRNYCEKCGSFEVSPITFISHSMSIKRIQYIFETMLPDLSGKTFLDVGSRLGAALFGAYYCSFAQKIIGVEINEDLCKLQRHVVEKYALSDRIQIICSDICNVPDTLQSANVILFNNVFQCFMPLEMEKKIWQWLRSIITVPGTIIVTIPSIEEILHKLQLGINISSWLRQIPKESFNMENAENEDDPDLLFDIFCYIVL